MTAEGELHHIEKNSSWLPRNLQEGAKTGLSSRTTGEASKCREKGKEEIGHQINSEINARDLETVIWKISLWLLKTQLFLDIQIDHRVNFKIECQNICRTRTRFLDGRPSCQLKYKAVTDVWVGRDKWTPESTISQTFLANSHSTKRKIPLDFHEISRKDPRQV